MNSNNWLSFPLSPNQSSLPPPLPSSQPTQFSLGLLNDSINNPFQAHHEWNLINSQDVNELPKIADFLGVNKSENQQDISAFNQITATDSDCLFPNDALLSVQCSGAAGTSDSDSQSGNNIQSLTLTMGSVKESKIGESSGGNNSSSTTNVEANPRRSLDTFGQRTSIYRGVTRHRWTGRYEAHLWDNSCRREGQSRKRRQVYLGGYDKEEKAARSYDLAALKYWGTSTTTNFPISNYEQEMEDMKNMTRQEFVAAIRRKSSGFSRGASIYRGVTRHHQHGRWQARIGRVAGNKDLYLGTFSTEEEAAEAYDIAAIKFRGLSAVTNFDMNRYDVKSILESNVLPIGGGAAKRLKEAQAVESSRKREEMTAALSSSFQYGSPSGTVNQAYPIMQQFEHAQAQPFLALQNQSNSQYEQNSQFNQSYIHNHHHQLLLPNLNSAFHHHGYLHTSPTLVHGMMNLGSPSSMMENSGSSSSYNAGYMGGGMATVEISTATNVGDHHLGSTANLALVKVDQDMPPGGYGGWSTDSIQGLNPGSFTMWND